MKTVGVSRKEIEEAIQRMGDYVKIDYLTRCLKTHLDYDAKKFALLNLARLYESRAMFLDAGRAMRSAAEINTNKDQQVQELMKSVELFIRGGNYELVDSVARWIFEITNEPRAKDIQKSIISLYKTQAQSLATKNRRKQAIGVYEKILTFDLDTVEKNEIQKTLLHLYESVGDIAQYGILKRKISSA